MPVDGPKTLSSAPLSEVIEGYVHGTSDTKGGILRSPARATRRGRWCRGCRRRRVPCHEIYQQGCAEPADWRRVSTAVDMEAACGGG